MCFFVLYLLHARTLSTRTQNIHFIVCTVLNFFRLIFQTKPTGFSDRLLQFTDKRFNFSLIYICPAVSCSNVRVAIQLWHPNPQFYFTIFICSESFRIYSYIRKCILMQANFFFFCLLFLLNQLNFSSVLMPLNKKNYVALKMLKINTAQFCIEKEKLFLFWKKMSTKFLFNDHSCVSLNTLTRECTQYYFFFHSMCGDCVIESSNTFDG